MLWLLMHSITSRSSRCDERSETGSYERPGLTRPAIQNPIRASTHVLKGDISCKRPSIAMRLCIENGAMREREILL